MNQKMKMSFHTLSALVLLLATTPIYSQDRPNRKSGDQRVADTVKAGDPAPDFTLKTKDGKEQVTLSGFRGKSPVVLIFGSYT